MERKYAMSAEHGIRKALFADRGNHEPLVSLFVPRSAFRVPSFLSRLHRDERGGMLEYVMVFAFVAVPLIFLMEYMLEVLSDYFGLIAYYVTWPFL
jgi:Flp pilus assembly pilin Flp